MSPRLAVKVDECCVGDAVSMIAPVTGNGMSIAFESAALAVEPLTAYARGELDWNAAQRRMEQMCDGAFRRRLRWAARLQGVMFHPSARNVLLPLATRCEWIWNLIFRLTR